MSNPNAILCRFFLLLFLEFSSQIADAILEPNYDNAEHELKVFDDRLRIPLILSCNITASGNYKLSWLRNDKEVAFDNQLQNRYNIIPEENKFIIPKPMEEDAGKFTCNIPELHISKDFNVVANIYFKYLPDSIAVVEGEKLTIHCRAFGTNPKISWIVDDQVYNESSGRYTLKKDEFDIENAIFIIDNAVMEDRKHYNCTATNDAVKYGNAGYTEAMESTYVRVKGKLAALWPFLGICAEVFVLCAIILIYEKRRNKTELEESDTDQSPEQEKLKAANK